MYVWRDVGLLTVSVLQVKMEVLVDLTKAAGFVFRSFSSFFSSSSSKKG